MVAREKTRPFFPHFWENLCQFKVVSTNWDVTSQIHSNFIRFWLNVFQRPQFVENTEPKTYKIRLNLTITSCLVQCFQHIYFLVRKKNSIFHGLQNKKLGKYCSKHNFGTYFFISFTQKLIGARSNILN
jgi:hypothetical protein